MATVHCVIDWIPSTDNTFFSAHKKRIEINVDFTNGIMSTICVMVKNPMKNNPKAYTVNYKGE
jgi:hypothetical protein